MGRIRRLVALGALCAAGVSCASGSDHPTSRELSVDAHGVTIRVRIVGAAEAATTLIAVHGGPGLSLESLATLDGLAKEHTRVVTYDQRGAGRSSSPPDGDYSLARQVADLEAVRAALGVATVQVAGESWGGAIAAAYAATYPDRVSALVLIDAMPLDRAEFLAGQQRFRQHLTELQKIGLVPNPLPTAVNGSCGPVLDAELPAYLADPRSHPNAEFGSCADATARATFAAFVKDESVERLGDQLRTYRGRALVVMGAADAFGLQWLDRNVELLAGATVQRMEIAHAGHVVLLERPAEVLAAIGAFLRRDA